MPKKTDADWKAIAQALAQRVNFAVTYLKAPAGGGVMMNMKTGARQHWREYMADAMEMVPGITVDRELMHTFDLPSRERKKAQAAIAKRKEHGKQACDPA